MNTLAKYTKAIGALAFLSALAIGWIAAPIREEPPESQAVPKREVTRERGLGGRDEGAREVVRKMKSIRAGATQEERILASISLAMSLPASEFAAWAQGDRFDFRAGPELNIFRMVLFERWIVEDPESLIGFTVKNNHGQAYRALDLLLKNDPEMVLEYFRAHPNDTFELGKLTTLAASDPGLVMARLAEMSGRGITAVAGEESEKLFRELAGKNATLLEGALDGLSPVLRKKAETALSGVRLEADFQAEFRSLWERPDGWEMFSDNLQANPKLAEQLIEEHATMPAAWKSSFGEYSYYAVRGDTAKKWLEIDLEAVGFSKTDAERIGTYAAEQLVLNDPDFVFSKFDSLNLDKLRKAQFFQIAFSRFKKSPEKAERLISMLGSEEDRVAAREQLELVKLKNGLQKKREPSDWIQIMGSAGTTSLNSYSFASETGRWDEKQVSEFQSGFNDLANKEKQKVALALASRAEDATGNERLTSDAINYLIRNPPEQDERGWGRDNPSMMAAQFALRLASKNLSEASAWIKTLPAGEAKKWAQRNVAKDLQQYDPAAVRSWVKTLPAAEREDVEGYLKGEE